MIGKILRFFRNQADNFCFRAMAFLAIDTRESLSQYDRIFCEDDSDNLWASLLKGTAFSNDNYGR